MSDQGTSLKKLDYNNLAKAIIEQYNGSTLAGSAQTLQAALNALNSKTSFDGILNTKFYRTASGYAGISMTTGTNWKYAIEISATKLTVIEYNQNGDVTSRWNIPYSS